MSIPYSTWLGNVRLIVEAFSSEGFQRDAWIGKVASSFSSPDEMMCVYFDDVIVSDFIEEHRAEIGEKCAVAGIKLTTMLNQFSWPMIDRFISSEALLNMDQWLEVRQAAEVFLRHLPMVDEVPPPEVKVKVKRKPD